MAFAYSVDLNDAQNLGAALDAGLIVDMEAALADWSQYIAGIGTLVVQISIAPTTRENGGPTSSSFIRADGTRNLWMPSSIYELTTGQHVAGTTSDITVTVDPTYLRQSVWVNPDPSVPTTIPNDRQDQVTIFRHEIGHGLGIDGFTDSTGNLGLDEYEWDTLLEKQSTTSVWFDGLNAMAAYGGKLPVTALNNGEAYSHLANSISEPLGQDLMNGVALNNGTSYDISTIDLAILKDLGVPTVSSVGTVPAILSITAMPARMAEGTSGITAFTFVATRSGDSEVAASANWATIGSGSTPANAADFTGNVLPSGVVSFGAGETSKTITINVAGDTSVEPDEGFTVTLSGASSGATLGTDAAAGGTIINDDTLGLGRPVFRFFDTHDGGHFFTTSTAELDQVLASRKDMNFEGIGYKAVDPAGNDPNAAPVYRFFDTHDGGHFFTISQAERDQVLSTRPDLKFEGTGYSEHTTQQAGDGAVYRFFETTSGGHFFTASSTERDTVLATRSDMRFEGIAFYAPT